MKIYIDVLIVTNFIITLIYIETLAKLTHKIYSGLRLFSASCLGGILSLLFIADGNKFGYAVLITVAEFVGFLLTVLILRK